MGFGGSASAMNASIDGNRFLRKRSTNRYKKLKDQYVGKSNSNANGAIHLTVEEVLIGRKRAEIYIKNRNRKNVVLSIVIGIISAFILYFLTVYFLGVIYI